MTAATKAATTVVVPPLGADAEASSQNGGGGASAPPSSFNYGLVRLYGRTLDDIERVRIMTTNRIGAIERELGVPAHSHKGLGKTAGLLDEADSEIEKELRKLWRTHPLAAWSKSVKGVGDKSIARLIAEIGDPLIRPVGHIENERTRDRKFVVDYWEPRTLAQLWAYCGHGDPARRKRTDMNKDDALALGNPRAKMRVHLIAKAGMQRMCPACSAHKEVVTAERKAAGATREEAEKYAPPAHDCTCAETLPLRHAYNAARANYAARIRIEERGERVGEPWSDKHAHNAALRYVGKTFLGMLYAEASKTATTSSSPPLGAIAGASSRNGSGVSS